MTTKESKKGRVLVGISGGVDSSVAVAILKKKGFSPVGIFMKFWGEGNMCCNSEAQERARSVCKQLEIPFYVLDVQKKFKERVVDNFLESYEKGDTPNPCVVCNRQVKFNFLMEKLKELKADYIATGHYARLRYVNRKDGKKTVKLLKAKDKNKDQSYFLWNLKKDWLKKIIFPLGDFKKEETRKMAKDLSLPTYIVSESQDLCFTRSETSLFLKENISSALGNIIDEEGVVLGKHKGAFLYTIGQRKGLNLPGGPYYVMGKKGNSVIVTKKKENLFSKEVFLKNINKIGETSFPEKVRAKVRYGSPVESATLEKGKLVFSKPQMAVCPGQSAVFYKGDELIGGGVITSF